MQQSRSPLITKDRGVAVGAVLIGAAYLIEAMRIDAPVANDAIGPSTFPKLLGVLLIASGVTLLLLRWRRVPAATTEAVDGPSSAGPGGVSIRAVALYVLVPAAVYAWLIPLLGFVIASMGYLAVVLWKFRPNRTVANIAISVASPLAIGALFGVVLSVPIPLWPYVMSGGV